VSRERRRHLLLTLRAGEASGHVPSHLDYLVGAARAASCLDRGPVDRALRAGGGFRALGIYGARASLGRIGEQHLRWNEVEEELGLTRAYQVEIAEPEAAQAVVDRLRGLRTVESARVQTLAVAPFSAAAATEPTTHPLTDAAWAPHERIRSPQAHRLEAGDERVTVGLVDTGISLGHPEFQRKLLAGYDTVDLGLDEAVGLRLVGDSRGDDFTPADNVGHGTHVGGIVGATGWELPPGVAGRSLLLPIRVLAAALVRGTTRTAGIGAEANINAGVKVAVDLGATVLNLSFGTSEQDVDPEGPKPQAEVVAYAARYGCVLVAASGNSGIAERYYPAALPEVIAVGSVGETGRRSSFSSYGDHVALCAPGERIVSCGITGLREGNGTSYAAPFVTGAAALAVSRARRRGHTLRPTQMRKLLVSTATPLAGTPATEVGAGLLNVEAAMRRLDEEVAG
jgi:subtilisin family serine protease